MALPIGLENEKNWVCGCSCTVLDSAKEIIGLPQDCIVIQPCHQQLSGIIGYK